MNSVKIMSLRLLSFCLGALGYFSFGGIVATATVQVLKHVKNSERFWLASDVARYTTSLERPASDFLHKYAHAQTASFDAALIIIGVVLLGLCVAADWAVHRIRVYRVSLEELQKIAERDEARKRANKKVDGCDAWAGRSSSAVETGSPQP